MFHEVTTLLGKAGVPVARSLVGPYITSLDMAGCSVTLLRADDEIEIGIGIHGEPGRRRVPLVPAAQVAELLVEPILSDLDFKGGDGVLAFVNGMGATPMLELYLMYNEVAKILEKSGVTVVRSLVGPYITSLDMAGCSVTLLKLDDELLRLWDAPVRTPGLRWGL
jgi:dihydroxyacetone kinase-like protein